MPDSARATPRVWRRIPGDGRPEVAEAQFPEVAEGLVDLKGEDGTVDVGLALSGGGIRASCQSLGVLKALHAKGYLSKVRYISSNSGSSWVNAPLSFLPESDPLDTFLGAVKGVATSVKQPSELTIDVLEKQASTEGSFAKAAGDAQAPTTLFSMRAWVTGLDWNDGIMKGFLAPFELFKPDAVMCPPVGTEGHRNAEAAVAKRGKGSVMPMRKGAAFPIIVAASHQRDTVMPSEGHPAVDGQPNEKGADGGVLDACIGGKKPVNCLDWHEIEFTPLYCGIPSQGTSGVKGNYWWSDSESATFGGGFIETFGFGSKKALSLPGGRKEVEHGERVDVELPALPDWKDRSTIASLSFAAGTSSSAVSVGLVSFFTSGEYTLTNWSRNVALSLNEYTGGVDMHLWSPADITSKNNRPTVLSDGGPIDNAAVLPLLRRGVKTVICHIAVTAPLDEGHMDAFSWPSLFGCATDSAGKRGGNVSAQVFPSEKFDDLLELFAKRYNKDYKDGENKKGDGEKKKGDGEHPSDLCPVVEQKLQVLRNDICGVEGGYEVRMVWCLGGLSASFKNALPEETRELLEPNWRDMLPNAFKEANIDSRFPYYPTTVQDYKPRLVQLLAENAAFNLMDTEVGAGDILDKIFGHAADTGTNKVRTPPVSGCGPKMGNSLKPVSTTGSSMADRLVPMVV